MALRPGDEHTVTDDVHLVLWDEKLKFFVESAVRVVRNWRLPDDVYFRVVSTEVAFPKVDLIEDVNWTPGENK